MKKAALKRKDFNTYVGDINYFSHVYGIHNQYEIAFEPCDRGFCVALYNKSITRELVGKRTCTEIDGYEDDRFHDKPRSESVWNAALTIADKIIERRLPKGIERI